MDNLTPEEVEGLRNRSRLDNAMIVGSEVRQLCNTIVNLRVDLEAEQLKRSHSEKRTDELRGEVLSLKRRLNEANDEVMRSPPPPKVTSIAHRAAMDLLSHFVHEEASGKSYAQLNAMLRQIDALLTPLGGAKDKPAFDYSIAQGDWVTNPDWPRGPFRVLDTSHQLGAAAVELSPGLVTCCPISILTKVKT